jgi:hypothetical protein
MVTMPWHPDHAAVSAPPAQFFSDRLPNLDAMAMLTLVKPSMALLVALLRQWW